MKSTKNQIADEEVMELASWASQELRQGRLCWRDVLGISEQEMQAVAQLAAALRRKGQLQQASSIYALLITHDPFQGGYWRAMAELLQCTAKHAEAAACYEVVALLEGRQRDLTRQQASCLEQIGAPELAQDYLKLAATLEK